MAGVPTRHAQPTRHPGVNAALGVLLSSVRMALHRELLGVVLHGSLALGDFRPYRSDVDFVVVTHSELPPGALPGLAAMHRRVRATGLPWVSRLEGSYLSQREIRRYDPAHTHHPALRVDGTFGVDHHGADWVIQRHVIREHGIALIGPDPHALIDPVRADALRAAAGATMREWWAPQLEDHTRIRDPEYTAYAVLTMCRVLYTMRHGRVAAKDVAARWAQQELGAAWAGTIACATAWRHGAPAVPLREALDLIRLVLAEGA
ncbi:MAG: DUF4111 domain-containing protein [Anaerolineae bacterium]|nr:DUF4111 domain-containing protein [Anaerolineae bacterium]